MRKFLRKIAAISTMFLATSCSDPDIADRAGHTPKLDIRSFFNGKVTGVGTTSDWHGKISNKFIIEMDCRWEGKVGTIDEVFTFDDGSVQNRQWNITASNVGHSFVATSADVTGRAEGIQSGDAAHFMYNLEIKYNKRSIPVYAKDYMYMMQDGSVMGEILFKKYGLQVGKINMHLKKASPRVLKSRGPITPDL